MRYTTRVYVALVVVTLACCFSMFQATDKPSHHGKPNPPRGGPEKEDKKEDRCDSSCRREDKKHTDCWVGAPTLCDPKGYKPSSGTLLYLYVWSGVENAVGADEYARVKSQAAAANKPIGDYNDAKDFVATIDLTTGSPCFGQVIAETDAPTGGNEPHHVGLNQNSSVFAVGGFNSWRYNQPSMYFFDVATNPAKPIYMKSLTPVKGAVADDLIRLPNGGFLVVLMGNTTGGTPGRVAEVDANMNLVAEHPRSDRNLDGFNPHGLAIASSANRFITLDYAEYGTTFKPSTYVTYRTTARIWDLSTREIVKVMDLGPVAKGLMTVRYLGPSVGNGAQFLITAGHGVLYLLDALKETVMPVYDFKAGTGHCVMTNPFRNATRIIVSLYTTDQLYLLDIANPHSVKALQTINLPKRTGPHATVLSGSERLLAISTYYVQHDHGMAFTEPFNTPTEKKIRLYTVAEDGNSFAPHDKVPIIDFKNLFPHKGIARPHGMAFKAVNVTK